MGRLDGKVAAITGAARGNGRLHAVRLEADVRDLTGLQAPVQEGLHKFGCIDVVRANAGIEPMPVRATDATHRENVSR